MTMLVLLVMAAAPASDTVPRVVETVPAECPAWAVGSGLSTEVALRVRVSADGRAERVQVVPYSTRHDVLTRTLRASFDSAAVRAVRQWRFRPARREGRPVAAWLQIKVTVAEPWTQSPGGAAQEPDSLRWPAIWKALMGEWWRVPIRQTPPGRPSAILFRPGGRFIELNAQGQENHGRFELASDDPADGMAARLIQITDSTGRSRRVARIRFASRDTLILCPGKLERCDTLVATARGGGL